MLNHFTNSLRFTLLAALGATATTGCGGNTGDDGLSGGTGGAAGLAANGGLAGVGATGGLAGSGVMGGTGGASSQKPVRTCTPAPDSSGTGSATCEEGWLHRNRAESCTYTPREDALEGYPPEIERLCERDADCTEKPYGYCTYTSGALSCAYGCGSDADCASTELCLCGSLGGVCVAASCRDDRDCGDRLCLGVLEFTCSPQPGSFYRFACDDPTNECLTSRECGQGEECARHDSGNRCERPTAVCGRPFLVAGSPRTASAISRSLSAKSGGTTQSTRPSGWADTTLLLVNDLPSHERRRLAEHWTELGLMEHASVAAFARFTLELLALGAPSSLVRATQEALGDEIAHAELCFTLASRFAGHAVEPGLLPVNGALDGASRAGTIRTAFLEACIGETLAAVEARLCAENAVQPDVRAALERIAADEARHAELGWRFLRWSLDTSSAGDRDRLLGELRDALEAELARDLTPVPGEPRGRDLAAFGLASPADSRRARSTAFRAVIVPCAAALGIVVDGSPRVAV